MYKALAKDVDLWFTYSLASIYQQIKMSDPLSITASIVGIVVPALYSTQLLLDNLQKLKEAPKTFKCLVEDIYSIDTALKLLQGIEDREWELLSIGISEETKTTISSCIQVYDLIRTDLQQWRRHSEDGKLV